jgi:hypothetical protein
MIIHFPLTYSMTGVKHGKASDYAYSENAAFEIREISSAEAPVSVRWSCDITKVCKGLTPVGRDFGIGDLSGEQETRWFEGRHWVRKLAASKGSDPARRAPLAADEFARVALTGAFNDRFFALDSIRGSTKLVQSDPTEGFETISSGNRDRSLAATERLSDDILLVDGIVHIACAVPHIAFAPVNYQTAPPVIDRGIIPHVVAPHETRHGSEIVTLRAPLSMFAEAILLADTGPLVAKLSRLAPDIRLPETTVCDENSRIEADFLAYRMLASAQGKAPPVWSRFVQAGTTDDKLAILRADIRPKPAQRAAYERLEAFLEGQAITLSLPGLR